MIILSLLILFLSVGVTSAATDISDESIMVNDNGGDTLVVSENTGGAETIGASSGNDYVLGDESQNTFSELNTTIQDSLENNSIKLTKDYIFTEDVDDAFTNGIIIAADGFTVDGDGHTLNGNNMARIFQITGSNVTLKNITFINGNATNGGAIYSTGVNFTLIDCTFINNTAGTQAAGIYTTGSFSKFINSTFINSVAKQVAALSIRGIHNLVDGCNFTNNFVTEYAAAVGSFSNYTTVKNSVFDNNTGGSSTGVVFAVSAPNSVVDNCTFISTNGGPAVNINPNNCSVIGCTFINNTAFSINFNGEYGLVENCGFDGNTNYAINLRANSNVTNCTFTNNTASRIINVIGENNILNEIYLKGNVLQSYIDVYYAGNDSIAANLYIDSVSGIEASKISNINATNVYYWNGDEWIEVIKNDMAKFNLVNKSINIVGIDNNDTVLINVTNITDENGLVYLDISNFSDPMKFVATFEGNEYYISSTCEFDLGIGGDFYLLQKLITDNAVNGNYDIELDRDYNYTIGTDTIKDGVEIPDNMTINVNGHTVDAQGMSRIFLINGENVTVKNGTLINGQCGAGGIICIIGESAIINNCTVINGSSPNYGGAIGSFANNSIISDSVFINCTAATDGSSVFVDAPNQHIINCTFINGTVGTSGGSLQIHSTAHNTEVINCTFINSTSDNYGGAIVSRPSNVTISGSDFINCIAKGNGGAIYIIGTNSTINNCTFINNTAMTASGGAIFTEAGGSVICSNFINNTVITGSGGAIFKNYGANLEVIDSNFEYNQAKGEGGAIFWRDNVALSPKITGSNFTNNTAGSTGGSVRCYNTHFMNMSNCRFINSTSGSNSGSLILQANNVTVDNCIFINSTATAQGGALRIHGTNQTVTNSFFENNVAGANGGAIVSDSGNNKFINNCTFIDNVAGTIGGAIRFTGTNIAVNNSTFISNIALNSSGGAVYFNHDYCVVNNSYFESNIAGTTGGAVHISGWADRRYSAVGSSIFINNTATDGGALYIYSLRDANGRATIDGVNYTVYRQDCTFIGNNAINGGALYIGSGSYGNTLTNYTFINNSAVNGGAVYYNLTAAAQTVTFKNSDFINNTATEYGGAIYRNTAGRLTLNNVNLTHNRAGSVLTVDEDADILHAHLDGLNGYLNAFYSNTSALFTYNKVRYWDGTQYVTSPASDTKITTEAGKTTNLADTVVNITGDISETELEDYRITDAYGDITYDFEDKFIGNRLLFYFDGNECYLDSGDSGEFGFGDFFILQKYIDDQIASGATNISLNRNYTYTEGVDTITDGIRISADNILIDGLGYTIDARGMSRIFNVAGNNVKIVNTVFTNGSAVDGGAVYWSGDDGFLADSWFHDNTAEDNGGAIYWNGDDGTILNSEFNFNAATVGSGIYANNDYLNVADNTFIGGNSTYDIYSNNILELKNNVLTHFIYAGEVSSPVDVIILDNDTVYASTAENVNLTAVIYDDNNNIVIIPDFKFVLPNGTLVAATVDLETGIYSANYLFTAPGTYNVSATDNLISKANITNGTVIVNEAISINVTVGNASYLENASISIQLGELPDSGNITIDITGPNNFTANYTINVEDYDNENITFDVPDLAAGTYDVTVRYSGNENIGANSDSTTFTVGKIDPEVVINAEDIIVGEDMIVNVTLPADATGNITVIINNKTYTVSSGENLNISDLPAGNYNATAIYDGDDNYNNITTTVTFEVNKISDYNMSLNTSDIVYFGDNATVTVDLPEDATGNVTATVNGTNYTAPVVNGTATLVIPDLGVGNYSIPIVYSGDDIYDTVSDNVTFNVELATDIIIAPDLVKYYKGPERLVINVTDPKGNPLVNTTVSILINNATYNRTTDSNGSCSMAINLGPGEYNVTINAGNATTNSSVTVISTINGTDIVKVLGNATSYYATFRDSNGNYLAKGSEVSFNINGVMYHHHIIDDEGRAKLDINLPQGEYVVTAINTATGEGASNNITVLPKITENNDLVKYYKNDSQYTVKIVDDNGNAVGAGVKVTFNINGRLYNRSTDENGVAKLNINLGKGAYIITAESEGCVVSNTIRVLPILTADNLVKDYGSSNQFVAHLVDGQGNNLPGEVVTFNINGVFYNRTTDSIGNARLNINLLPGEYIITSMYGDFGISNYVKILS